jgi:hypothetical protein
METEGEGEAAQQADRTDTRLRRVQFIRHAFGRGIGAKARVDEQLSDMGCNEQGKRE